MNRNKIICEQCRCMCRIYDINTSRGKKYMRTVAWLCMRTDDNMEKNFIIKNMKQFVEHEVPERCLLDMEYLILNQSL